MISDKNSSSWTIAHTTNSEIVTKVKISERQIFEHIEAQIELNLDITLNEEEELVLAYILSGKRLLTYSSQFVTHTYTKFLTMYKLCVLMSLPRNWEYR